MTLVPHLHDGVEIGGASILDRGERVRHRQLDIGTQMHEELCKQWQAVASSGKQWQAVASSGKQWQAVAISGNQWQSDA
jgi:hypothetical protein